MESLLKFILSSIFPQEKIPVAKEKLENNLVIFSIKPKPEDAGVLIGKNGKVIKAISRILKIKATLMKKKVALKVITENKA